MHASTVDIAPQSIFLVYDRSLITSMFGNDSAAEKDPLIKETLEVVVPNGKWVNECLYKIDSRSAPAREVSLKVLAAIVAVNKTRAIRIPVLGVVCSTVDISNLNITHSLVSVLRYHSGVMVLYSAKCDRSFVTAGGLVIPYSLQLGVARSGIVVVTSIPCPALDGLPRYAQEDARIYSDKNIGQALSILKEAGVSAGIASCYHDRMYSTEVARELCIMASKVGPACWLLTEDCSKDVPEAAADNAIVVRGNTVYSYGDNRPNYKTLKKQLESIVVDSTMFDVVV